MSYNVPMVIQSHWAAQTGLPSLWLEYAPDPLVPPLAVMEATGFSRTPLSAGSYMDSHNYRISILTTSAESTWSIGESAIEKMDTLSGDKITSVQIEPDSLARPAKVGQLDVWVFEFTLKVEIFDN